MANKLDGQPSTSGLPRVIGVAGVAFTAFNCVVAVATSGSFRQLAVLSVAGTLVLYLICCLGVLRLRAKNIAGAGSPFIAPGGPIVPVAGAAMCLWLLSTLAMREIIATLAFIVIATLIYSMRYAKTRSQDRNLAQGQPVD